MVLINPVSATKTYCMNLFTRFFTLITLSLVFSACNKEVNPLGEDPPPETIPKYLLRSLEYKSFNATSVYTYNPDSTIQKIVSSSNIASSITNFTYSNKMITNVHVSLSQNKVVYTYTQGKVSSVFFTTMGRDDRGHKLSFTYNSVGKVSKLHYTYLNEAGEQPKYVSTYEYNAFGLPSKIVSVTGNTTVTWYIEEYSGECDFSPFTFIHYSLDELYELYNYPVISQVKRLPKKIVETIQTGGATAVTEKIVEIDFTIVNKRIDKMVTHLNFVRQPQYNTSSEVIFNY